MPTVYEVTFRIVRSRCARPAGEDERAMAGIVLAAAGLADARLAARPQVAAAVDSLRSRLEAGAPVRVRLDAEALARFFLLRRAAGPAVAHRLKWGDAVEVAAPDEKGVAA